MKNSCTVTVDAPSKELSKTQLMAMIGLAVLVADSAVQQLISFFDKQQQQEYILETNTTH